MILQCIPKYQGTFEYIQKLSYKNFDLKYLPHVMGHSRINLYLNSYSAPDEVFENKFYWFLFCKI